jgi:hypothetical protein
MTLEQAGELIKVLQVISETLRWLLVVATFGVTTYFIRAHSK